MFWGLRSRIKWLKWGDRNTKFFHATTIQRRSRNRISMLLNDQGEWVRNEEDLKNMTMNFFKNIYTSEGPRNFQPILDNIPTLVNASMNQKLMAPVTMEEIIAATHQLGPTKAPGPDGLHGLFFQHHWNDIGRDICCEVQHFFQTGILNPALNKTQITLIPKTQNPEKIGQYRPISLCNFAYKSYKKSSQID